MPPITLESDFGFLNIVVDQGIDNPITPLLANALGSILCL
jgi:hypothetical protein